MSAPEIQHPDTAALFCRAENAVRESRRLVASIQEERKQAVGLMHQLRQIGAEFDRPRRILYPRDTVDTRVSGAGG